MKKKNVMWKHEDDTRLLWFLWSSSAEEWCSLRSEHRDSSPSDRRHTSVISQLHDCFNRQFQIITVWVLFCCFRHHFCQSWETVQQSVMIREAETSQSPDDLNWMHVCNIPSFSWRRRDFPHPTYFLVTVILCICDCVPVNLTITGRITSKTHTVEKRLIDSAGSWVWLMRKHQEDQIVPRVPQVCQPWLCNRSRNTTDS